MKDFFKSLKISFVYSNLVWILYLIIHSKYMANTNPVQNTLSLVYVYEAQLSKFGSHKHLEATLNP